MVASEGTYILLLLPVPKSIMMCLLLMLERLSFKQRMILRDYEPIEEHNGAGIVQLIHLNGSRIGPDYGQDRTIRRTLLKSGTSVMSQR